MRTFDNTIAIVTGAGSGIGRAVAVRLAGAGARVALLDADAAGLEETAEAISSETWSFTVDVRDPGGVQASVAAVAEHGAPGILVNGAGIAIRKGLLTTTLDEWQRVLDINLTGYFVVLQAVVPAMRDGGAIVQVGSIAAHIGYGYPSYTAAKGGVLAMTRQLAGELAEHGIRINSVSPGVVRTGLNRDTLARPEIVDATVAQIPQGRLGAPEDVAAAVEYLAHPDSEFVNGADLVIDGGMTSKLHWGSASSAIKDFHAD